MRLRRGSRAGGGRPERADRAGGTGVEEKSAYRGDGRAYRCVARRMRVRTRVEEGALDHGLGGLRDRSKGRGRGRSPGVSVSTVRVSLPLRAWAARRCSTKRDLLQQTEGASWRFAIACPSSGPSGDDSVEGSLRWTS